MQYSKTIFPILVRLNADIIVKNIVGDTNEVFDKFTRESFQYIMDFIRDAKWTKSKSFKFICANMGLKSSDLARFWLARYGKEKSESTFRLQKTQVSRTIEAMLGSGIEIERAFLSQDVESITEIVKNARSFSMGDLQLGDIVDESVLTTLYELKPVYVECDLRECIKEMNFLLAISKASIEQKLKELDVNKLYFLCSVLKEELYTKTGINTRKLNLLKTLHVANKSDFDSTLSVIDFTKSYFEARITPIESSDKSTEIDKLKKEVEYYRNLYEAEKNKADSEISNDGLAEEIREGFGGMLNVPIPVCEAMKDAMFGGALCGDEIDSEALYTDFTMGENEYIEKLGLLNANSLSSVQELLITLSKYDSSVIRQDILRFDRRVLQEVYSMFQGEFFDYSYNKEVLQKRIEQFVDGLTADKNYTKAISKYLVESFAYGLKRNSVVEQI